MIKKNQKTKPSQINMLKKTLPKKIEKKLEQLQELITKINEVQAINPEEPETWDSDTLYNLTEHLKEALRLLEDKTVKGKYDNWGEPLILEEGLCSLVDEYHSEEEEE